MSKNFDQNFSLKDWVTNRVANAPETVEEDTVLQVQNGVDLIMRAERIRDKMKMPEAIQEMQDEAELDAEDTRQQHKMTAKISSGITAPIVNASPTQQIQIVRLLRDLGDRLRQSEKEREILWRELDSCRKLLTDIEDKTNNTEKAYLTIENRLNTQAAPVSVEESEEAKEFRKNIEDKINALETTTGSAVLRLEDAITENGKLARRLEQVSQERIQLINKIEEMEETLAETQDTLRAKALVLLTDHALANKTALPQTPAWNGNDTLRTKEAAPAPTQTIDEAFGLENRAWWKSSPSMSMSKTALVSLIALGLVGGWALTKVDMPILNLKLPETTAPAEMETPAKQSASQVEGNQAALSEEQKSMNEMAKMANAIEPGSPEEVAAEQATAPAQNAEAAPAVNLAAALTPDAEPKAAVEENPTEVAKVAAKAAEVKARDAFEAAKPTNSLAQRIKTDATLPAVIKPIETKAFAGDAAAQHDLAAVYTAGHAGVKLNYSKAAQWFSEAAHNGVGNAQYNLAVLYHQGLGVKQDTTKAIDLYRVAASNGHPEAQYNLGIAHIEGLGADYNPQIAAYYFQQAASGGVVEAAYNLGLIQENGLLGEAQPDEAIFWYKLAADHGNKQAKESMAQLAKQLNMSADQANETFKRISAQKPEYTKGLTVPAAAAAPAQAKPAVAATKPAAPVKAETPKKTATKDPVSLSAPAPAKASSFDPVIVAQIQEQLIRLGLFSGSADGAADKATQDAVKSYQSMNKLKVDGKPSEDVLVHMLASDMQTAPASGTN